jgi:transposase
VVYRSAAGADREEAGTHSIWISEQLQELGHEVIVANVRELRAISHRDRKSNQLDAGKLARYARLDSKILRPIAHRTVAQIRARNLIVRLRTAAVNAVGGLAKPCGYRLPASSTLYRSSFLFVLDTHLQGSATDTDPRNSTAPAIT